MPFWNIHEKEVTKCDKMALDLFYDLYTQLCENLKIDNKKNDWKINIKMIVFLMNKRDRFSIEM